MKKLLLLPLAVLAVNVAQAEDNLPTKSVSLPFYNQPILTTDYSGLSFNYDMAGTPDKKVVCTLSGIYKSWLDFSNNGARTNSNTYGGNEVVILTSSNASSDSESVDIFHADTAGNAVVNDTRWDERGNNGLASCFYETDNSVK